MEQVVERNHVVRLRGIPTVIPDARIGKCANCDRTQVSAVELRRWEGIQRESLLQSRQIPSPADIRSLRETLQLSVANFASLLGITRQTAHSWERTDTPGLQVSPATLLLGLLNAEVTGAFPGVLAALRLAAEKRGQAIPPDDHSADKEPPRDPPLSPTPVSVNPTRALRRRPAGIPTFCSRTAA
jgi:DNA-binding transcriptional regulator YiaG